MSIIANNMGTLIRGKSFFLFMIVLVPWVPEGFYLEKSRDPASWSEESYSVLWLDVVNWQCVGIGCLLIDSRDTYRSMIVTLASSATRGFSLASSF